QRAERAIADRESDPTYFAFVAEAADDEPWDSVETAKKCKPSFGYTLTAESFEEPLAAAREDAELQNNYERYRLDRWVQNITTWITDDVWMKNAKGYSEQQLEGRRCWAGVDLASKVDLCAMVLLFEPIDDSGAWPVLARFWTP